MAGGGGGDGKSWIYMLGGGGAVLGAAFAVEKFHVGPSWLHPLLLAIGGLAVVFGSCEAMSCL